MPASPYTRERLEEAAASSRTMSEALRKLGVDPKGTSRRYLRDRMRSMGVDTSHFEREGTRWAKERLEDAVALSTNMCEVLRRLGLDPVGGQHTHISRRIKNLGIDTSHFSPVGRRKTKARRRCSPEELLVHAENPGRRMPSHRLKAAMLALGADERCTVCRTGPVWRNRPLPLEVDHIDGNWRNNCRENLRFLCPNCHSATDTYRGRNKGVCPRDTGAPQ
ncbi:HNH endonuclease [Streptomyces sp. RPA4-5]|uniref:HNH endonuclease signature motif containing protein n=1 Tax=unclassified Streptomyces TaxID=2593676 RepID=UPI00143EC7C5|nr:MULTISPECIES: HNH endonuclease signature motif containing protein [unclassified Streptomyces]QIY55710.1 HNH endonuclease [Streptomyces sp. RPA4-5]WJY38495.1 HNH endonuclease signature motif containing protein [Streptomyces sp. P9-2B-2]